MQLNTQLLGLLGLIFVLSACNDTSEPPEVASVPVSSAETTADGIRGQTLALVNAHRRSRGLKAVVYSTQLQAAADAHAAWMVRTGSLSHRGQGGSSIASRARAAGFCATSVNENIAQGYSSANAVMAGWLASGPHRRNIRNAAMDHGAVGVARGADGTLWWALKMGSAC